MVDAGPERVGGSSTPVDKVVNAEALTPQGYERLTELGAERALRLTTGKPIELIFGLDHKIELSRRNDGIVRISVDGFKLPDPGNEEDDEALVDELELPVGVRIEIGRSGGLTEIQTEVQEDEDNNDVYFIDLPDTAINFYGEQIDFTDVEAGIDSVLSILIGRRSKDDEVIITNWDVDSGVAVPRQQPESDDWSRSEAEPNSWNSEMAGMLRSSAAQTIYEKFMGQSGADNGVAMIVAVMTYLYQDQLQVMGKEEFTSLVKGIRAALPKI